MAFQISSAQSRKVKKILRTANYEMTSLRYAYAIPLYKSYLMKGGSDTTAYKNLAAAYLKINAYDSALQYYQMAKDKAVNTLNIIPELYAVLGNYKKAKELYLNLIAENNTLLSNARVYGFSNLDKFTTDSLDYKIAYTNINTPYNDYNAVLYKEGLVFESNRVNKIYKKRKSKKKKELFKKYEPEFGWDGAGYSKLYFIPSMDSIHSDSISVGFFNEKVFKYAIDDYSVNNSNDVKKVPTTYDKKVANFSNTIKAQVFKPFQNDLNIGSISFTQDANTAYYTKNQVKSKGVSQLEIWESKYINGFWTSGNKLFINNTNYSFFHPAITPDGKRLYYISDDPNGRGGTDIYFIDKNEDGSWKPTQNAGQDINTEGDELFPTYYNGSLYFSSNGHPGLGGLDIFKLEKNNKGGLLIKNMGYPINSSKDDLGFSIYKNKGFFSSNRNGSDDIYSFDFIQANIVLKGKLLVDNNCVGNKKVYLYQNDQNGIEVLVDSAMLDNDCNYEFSVRPNQNFSIVAYDLNGNKLSNAVASNDYSKLIDTYTKNMALINLPLPKKVLEDRLAKEKAIQLAEEIAMAKTFKLTIDSLKTLTKDYIELHHPFDQVYVVKEDLNSYYKIIERVKRMKGKKIIIVSAADCNGSFEYNENLSERRAKRIYATLSKLSTNNVIIRNVGERELIEACDKATNNKALQKMNRYSYVFILDK
jgi:outer membrane protein OmpA-like peptidoglycan-associated protein/tetratricopeptide (TPR) repeat protein